MIAQDVSGSHLDHSLGYYLLFMNTGGSANGDFYVTALRDDLGDEQQLTLCFRQPVAKNAELVTRTHPLVEALRAATPGLVSVSGIEGMPFPVDDSALPFSELELQISAVYAEKYGR